MSKKQIRKRLEDLFLGLSESTPSDPGQEIAVGSIWTGEKSALAENWTGLDEPRQAAALTGWAWEVDRDFRYTYCGQEAADILKYSLQDILGKSILAFAIHPESHKDLEALFYSNKLPAEANVLLADASGACIPARMHVLSRTDLGHETASWRGFTQCLPEERKILPRPRNGLPKANGKVIPPTIATTEGLPSSPSPEAAGSDRVENRGVAFDQQHMQPSSGIWTETGKRAIQTNTLSVVNSEGSEPATIAIPLETQGAGRLLLEIIDDSSARNWSEDDRFLVMEVAAQLALALDNAELYISVQQELAERIRAEQAILRRNRDLAALNQVGQQLNRLATRAEIFELLAAMIGEVLENSNLYICAYSPEDKTLSFPVCLVDGRVTKIPERPFNEGIPEYAIRSHTALFIAQNAAEELRQRGIDLPDRIPASVLAIPMVTGEKPLGAIVVQDFVHENAFDTVHVELLSTAASQAATALENADLFQQMQHALEAIENRERYQASVARSAAALTEFGTKSLPDVLKILGTTVQCSRVYYAQFREDEHGAYWSATAEWTDPVFAYLFDKERTWSIPASLYPTRAQILREQGWISIQSTDKSSPETEFLNSQHIRSCLLLAVPGSASTPDFIAFDQLGADRSWHNEEINALRMAADAISNTFVREGLLDRLKITLDETENLYKASNRLALASDMQEMVSAVLSGVRAAEINRAVLLIFEYDAYAKIDQIRVGANWYSGHGTPPPSIGLDYPLARYEHLLQAETAVYFEDILEAPVDTDLQDAFLHENIRALAILPLWSGKRQVGALLLESETRHYFGGREIRAYAPLSDQMAVFVENQRLFEQTQAALSETELLYQISNRISKASSAPDMLSLVTESILPAGADKASLLLIESDPAGQITGVEMVGSQDMNGKYQPLGMHLPVESLPIIKSLADEPLLINNTANSTDDASFKTFTQLEMGACCLVPLRTGGRMIGILIASAQSPIEFQQEDTNLLRIAGNGIAVALEKQRLLVQAQRRALELQTASEIARDTASTLSLDLLLSRIVKMLSERFNFYHTAIFLLDETRTTAIVRESTGSAEKVSRNGQRIAVGSRSVVGTITGTGVPLILNDVAKSPAYSPDPLLPETRSEMGVPLRLGSTVIGALDLHSKETNAFNQDDVTVLQILSDQIAIAIENARAYELSQKAIADMQEVDRVKSQFLANMSHELRTPLNSIIGFSRVILKGIDGPINEVQQQDLSAIYNSGQHLLSLITDILDLSKIEAGKMELAFTEINVADLINSAMSTASGLVKDKAIQLHSIVPDNLPLVRADNTRVRQVLINFLSNAAKFTDEGTITVDASLVNGPNNRPEIMVAVTDTGSGIAPQDQGKLFLPFSQVDDSPTRKTGGTGLGLSICRSLIEMHGGRIGLLRSEVDTGSTFFFTLPVSSLEPEILPQVGGATSNIVLAIDDDQKVISLYERYLEPHGYQIIPLTDPNFAVPRAKETKPFAITLDIMMPGKDGWQVLRELKNDPETRDIPIIVCSIMESQEKGFSMGATDYLVKPFIQEEMIAALTRLDQDGNIREVLIVDDDTADLRLVQKMLEEYRDYHVTLARGGKEGWEIIRAKKPDAIILDLFMPDMNGFQFLQNMRADPTLREVPVVVLTGADLTPEQHQQLAEFGQGVLGKGYLRENELLVLLKEALRKFRPPVRQSK